MSRSRSATALGGPEQQFLNREHQLGQIASHLEALDRDPGHLKILEVVGFGGAGKTELLKRVREKTAFDWNGIHRQVFVSLEEVASTTETGPLLAIRDKIGIECLLFDTALLSYWRSSGQGFNLERSDRLSNSLVVKSLELGGSAAGIAPLLPLAFGLQVFRFLKRSGTKLSRYKREEFERIDELREQPRMLREELPHYLGLDIERGTASTPKLVAFYDGYDRQGAPTLAEKAPWMQKFIQTLDRGVHIVSTREPLDWDEVRWGKDVETVYVEELPDKEAREMIRTRLGGLAPELEDRLIEASGRIPFFVDTVIAAFTRVRDKPQLVADDLPSSPEDSVDYLLEHLEVEERELAFALATVQIFDRALYIELVKALNMRFNVLKFHEFVKWFFVEEVSPELREAHDSLETHDLHKTHDLLSAFVRDSSPDAGSREACLEAATDSLLVRCGDGTSKNLDATLLIFRGVMAGWHSTEAMQSRSVEALIDASYLLYDAGYWNQLASIVSEGGTAEGEHPIAVISEFFTALTTRRIDGIEPAIKRFEVLQPRTAVLGRHERSAELELAYLREIAGDYAGARQKFGELVRGATPFDPADRTQRRSRMYHADMLIMDGKFIDGSKVLSDTYGAVGASAMTDWGEMVRLHGHAHRFSFMLEQAAELYLTGMRATAAAPGLLGKLQTALAEAYCWYDPRLALGSADAADEINLRLGNQIELAKCGVARSIALAKLGEFGPAREVIEKAAHRAEEVGYPACVAFSLQAKVVIEWLADNLDGANTANEELTKAVKGLDTYSHLQAAPRLLLGDDKGFAALTAEVEWFEADRLEARLAEYLMPQ